MSGVSASTWARLASSGTTPPNRPCTSSWLETRFDGARCRPRRPRRPSRRTRSRCRGRLTQPRRRRAGGHARPSGHRGGDPVEQVRGTPRVHVVDPHDQRVLVRSPGSSSCGPRPGGTRTARTAAARPSSTRGPPARRPRRPCRRRRDQLVQQPRADLAAVVVGLDGDRRDVGLVAVADHPAVADHVAVRAARPGSSGSASRTSRRGTGSGSRDADRPGVRSP